MSASHHPNIQGLLELARRDGVDIRPTLLRVLVDLYIQECVHTPSEQARFIELVCRLLDGVDPATRAAVAQRFALYTGVPIAVALKLARDEIAVAEPILRQSLVLGEAELHSILDSTGPAHAIAIASRVDLPKSIVTRLSGLTHATAEKALSMLDEIRAAAVWNGDMEPSPSLVPAAVNVTSRTASLAKRYFDSNEDERRRILVELGSHGPLESNERLQRADPVSIERLEQAALRHRPQEFALLLEQMLGFASALAARIITDPAGDPIAVVCRALDLPFETASRILLFLNPDIGRSVQRVFALADFYETIGKAAAQRLVAAWCRSASPGHAVRQSVAEREAGDQRDPRMLVPLAQSTPVESAERRAATRKS